MDNVRRFLVVFVAMFFVAAAIVGFILAHTFYNVTGEQVEEVGASAPTYDPDADHAAEKSFQDNILCVIGDKTKPETELLCLLNVDSSAGSVSFLFIPKDMKYGISSTQTVGSFGKVYASFDANAAQQTAQLVAAFLDIDVRYYMALSTEDFGKLISTFSSEDQGVSFTVPVDLQYTDDTTSISLRQGPQYLKGESAAQFIQFYRTTDGVYSADMLKYYDGTDVKRIEMVQQFFSAFVSQKFTGATTSFYKDHFTELFLPYLEKGETNLTEEPISAIASVFANLQASNVNFFMLNGNSVFNQTQYLEFNGYMRNFLLADAVSTVNAADVLAVRFRSSVGQQSASAGN